CNANDLFELRIIIDKDKPYIIIELVDDGTVFDINEFCEPSIDNIAHQKRKGGLGIRLVKSIMDKIEYKASRGQTGCRLTKNITKLILRNRQLMTRMFCMLIIGSVAWRAAGQDQGKRQRSRDILFEVNNRKVTSEEFIYLYRKNHQSTSGYTAADINEYLDLFVNFKLKVEEARSRGMDTTAAFLSEYRGYRNELLKPYLPDSRIMDSLVTQAYDRMKEEVRASHLLISLPADAAPGDTLRAYNRALEIRESVRAGEDFGSLAAAYSDDPQAKSSGGDLGFFTALQMVHPFETAAYEAKPGELVGPVRTQFGYHLIKVTDRRPARGQVAVSHIMLRTGGERDSTEVREKIFNLYDQLMAGASWDELCAEYSEDPGSKSKGGS